MSIWLSERVRAARTQIKKNETERGAKYVYSSSWIIVYWIPGGVIIGIMKRPERARRQDAPGAGARGSVMT